MEVPPTRLLPNLCGSLAVLAAVGLIAFGLPALDRAFPAERPVPAGQRYAIGGGVSVLPPPGAMLDVTKTRPRADRGTALFLLGPVRYAIVVDPFAGPLPAAAARLRRKITATRGYQVAGRETPVTTANGVGGLQGGYTAPGRVGRYCVFLTGPLAVEVTVSGTGADLRDSLAGIEASTRSLEFRDGP